MARLSGSAPRGLGFLQWFAAWSSKRRFGKVAEPISIMARHVYWSTPSR